MRIIRPSILFRLLAISLTTACTYVFAEEVSLLNSEGDAVAYIDVTDDLTIYLWSGEPVAYISGENVYGFNGKHLGWFLDGVVRNHDGDASCVVKQLHSSPNYESYKGYKSYKPYKSYTEYAPYKPYFTNQFSPVPCSLALALGAN